MARTVLIVIDRSPYGDWQGREALDMALSLAAFDQPVAILFRGAGVNWLRAGQDGAAVGQKTVSRNLGAARVFGVEEILADQQDLKRYAIEQTDPQTRAVTVSPDFYRQYGQVIQP